MANRYIQPTAQYRMGVKAKIGEYVANFAAMFFDFPIAFADLNHGDHVIPSYDGYNSGLLEAYQYTVVAGSRVALFGALGSSTSLKITGSTLSLELGSYVTTGIGRIRARVSNASSYFIEGYYGWDGPSNSTVGIMVAHFTDDVYIFSYIRNTITENTPFVTYNPPYQELGGPPQLGYAVIEVNAGGYAQLQGDFYIDKTILPNQYTNAADIVMESSYVISTDPYDNFPEPEDHGGDGEPGAAGDDIDIPPTPSISAGTSGLVTLYNPSLAQLRALATYLWSGPFDLSSFKKIFADPMDCILGLSIVPVAVPSGVVQPITIGNVSTDVNVSTASTDYVELDCGTLAVTKTFNSYLDYAPFTTVDIYLPYIGTRHLDTDNIMPKGGESSRSIKVVYKIDLFSGGCIAFIKCGSSVIYSFAGQCSTQVPVTGNNWTDLYKAIAGIASSAIGSISSSASFGSNFATTQIGDKFHKHSSMASMNNASRSNSVGASSVADAVFSAKPQIEKSGVMGSAVGLLGIQKPYLIIRRPVPCIPRRQNEFTGYPSNYLKQLKDLSGYVEMEEIHLEHIPATENEIEEIYSLLKSGVLI